MHDHHLIFWVFVSNEELGWENQIGGGGGRWWWLWMGGEVDVGMMETGFSPEEVGGSERRRLGVGTG